MKELLTASFWKGVKKTYEDALKGPAPEPKAIEPPAEEPAAATPDSQPHSQPPE